MALRAVISNVPSNGGATITALQSRRNLSDGTIATLGGTTAGTYEIADSSIGDSVQIRAVNSVGNGAWSDAKTIGENPELLLNASFDDTSTWAGTDDGGVSGNATEFVISGGNLTITDRGGSFADGVFQAVSFAAATYNVAVTVDEILEGSGGVRIKIDGFDIPELTPLTTPGTYTATYTSPSAATRNFIISVSSPTTQARVSAVSVKLAA